MSRGSRATGARIAVAAACAIACAGCSLSFPDRTDGDTGIDTGTDTFVDMPLDNEDWPWDTPADDADGPIDPLPDAVDVPDPGEDVDPADDSEAVSPDDWDGDCISNSLEDALGTDPWGWDTDGDGCWDMVEAALGTDATDDLDNPGAHGDYAFVVPYGHAAIPATNTLVITYASVQKLDVFLLMDATYGMAGELGHLQSSFSSTIVPAVSSAVADTQFGFGTFADYPVAPYGAAGDVVFDRGAQVQDLSFAVQSAIDAATVLDGGDAPEAAVPALWAVATGDGLGPYLAAAPACPGGYTGYPCFRLDAMPVIAMITDAAFHDGPGGSDQYTGIDPVPPTYAEAVAELSAISARVACWETSGGGMAFGDCQALALDTGSIDGGGAPAVASGASDGTGLASGIAALVTGLAVEMTFDATLRLVDPTPDSVDAVLAFLDGFQPNEAGGVAAPETPSVTCSGGLGVRDMDGDTMVDSFTGVEPGTTLCFDVQTRANDSVENPSIHDAIYHARALAIGNGRYDLGSRDIYFVVPPDGCAGAPWE